MNPTLKELREKPHWSFSSLNTLLNICSLQWAFEKVYREIPQFTPLALVFGGVFHDCCGYVALMRMAGKEADRNDVLQRFADLFVDQTKTRNPPVLFRADKGEELETVVDLGQRMLSVYLESLDPEEKVLGAGIPFSVFLHDVNGELLPKPLIGEFDLVVSKEMFPIIVDWKTASKRWTAGKEHEDLQATAYLHAYRTQHRSRHVGFRFEVVTKTKNPSCTSLYTARDEDDTLRMAELMRFADRIVEQGLFVPSPSFFCGGCPHKTACASWHLRRKRTVSVAA